MVKRIKYSLSALMFGILLLVGVAGSGANATDIEDKTCKDLEGFSTNLEVNSDGAWGSIEFDSDNGPLILNVNDGYEVDLCVKKGSEASGQGPVDLGSFEGPIEDQAVNYPGSVPSEGFSHYAFAYRLVDEPGYFFQFKKVWTGDEIDLEGVEVVFDIDGTKWTPGDPAVAVEPGDVLSPLTEEVTGLPENCTYESDLPESYIVFEEWQNEAEVSRSAVALPQRYLDTLTVTNEVTCEEEGEVLGGATSTPATPKQVVAPAGAVNAGAGNTSISPLALAGFTASLIATGFAVTRSVKGE